MTFRPRMTSVHEGISVVGELQFRAWNGVVADLWHARLAAGARGEYVSEHPRMFVLLEQRGGPFYMRTSPGGAGRGHNAGCMSFVPAGMPLWGDCEVSSEVRHLDLHFEPRLLADRLGEDFDSEALESPRLVFSSERLFGLAALLAEECAAPQGLHDLYGESLTLALMIDFLGLQRRCRQERGRSPLAAWQLRRVTDYMAENCGRSIRLQELADLVNLSQSYFSHAFKASTGLPPHRWQMNARIAHAQALLLRGGASLTEIAAATGFADQAHLTRAFRRIVGDTPASWQRARRSA